MTGRVNFSEHEDRWLSLEGRMQDGSVFKLAVTQTGKRKAKPKRKYTKIQDRVQEEISLVMRVSPEQYPHLERLQAALHPERLQTHALLALKGLAVEGPLLRLRAETGQRSRLTGRYGAQEAGQEQGMTAGKIISLLAFLFAGLSHCRADAPPAPAGAPTASPPSG